MQPIFEDDYLQITARDAVTRDRSGVILLSFTGIGHAMGEIDVQAPEFIGAGREMDNILFITDKTRSWGNRINFERLAALLAPFGAEREFYAIGNSMGGTLAIMASRFIPMWRVMALVPQYSVDPKVAPWETRWRAYVKAIEAHRAPALSGCFEGEAEYFILSSGQGLDARQATRFPLRQNLRHWVFDGLGHDLAAELKAKGQLAPLIRAFFAGEVPQVSGVPYRQVSPIKAG